MENVEDALAPTAVPARAMKFNFVNFFLLLMTILCHISLGYYYEDDDYDYYHQLDYHRPRDRDIALRLQAKAVENQGNLLI